MWEYAVIPNGKRVDDDHFLGEKIRLGVVHLLRFHRVLECVQESFLDERVLLFVKTPDGWQKVVYPPVSPHHTKDVWNRRSTRFPNAVDRVRKETHIQGKKGCQMQTMSKT